MRAGERRCFVALDESCGAGARLVYTECTFFGPVPKTTQSANESNGRVS